MPLDIKFERFANLPAAWVNGRSEQAGTAQRISLRLPVLLLAALALWPPLASVIAWAARRSAPGTCAACGYDLRATVERCPECGSTDAEAHAKRAAGRAGAAVTALLILAMCWLALGWYLTRNYPMRLLTLVDFEVPPVRTNDPPYPGATTVMLWLDEHSLCLMRFGDFVPDDGWGRLIPTGVAEKFVPAPFSGLMWLEPAASSATAPDYQAFRLPLWMTFAIPMGWIFWSIRRVRARGGFHLGRIPSHERGPRRTLLLRARDDHLPQDRHQRGPSEQLT